MATLWSYAHFCFCSLAVLVLGIILLFLMYQLVRTLQSLNQESTADIPPGSRGLPLIGETLQFMAAIKSGKGFYEFVRIRRLWYIEPLFSNYNTRNQGLIVGYIHIIRI